MNEFIVWNKDLKHFLGKSGKLQDRCTMRSDGVVSINDDYSVHNYIGKTDINSKKIYADSSIVEIKLYESDSLSYHNPVFNGYFKYNTEKLQYEIIRLDSDKSNEKSNYPFGSMPKIEHIKIIDTIQENKLGLIKCTT